MAEKDKIKLQRAKTPNDLLKMKFETIPFEPGPFYDLLGHPEKRGVWLVWGQSQNGKTSFIMQLMKELSKHGKVLFDSLEESFGQTLQNSIVREGLQNHKNILLLRKESMEDLSVRLSMRRSPDFVLIDSFQYTGFSFKEYKRFTEKHADKLIIFTSQADGKLPKGRTADSVRYDVDQKLFVRGFRAISLGRFKGPTCRYTIYEKGEKEFYGDEKQNENEKEITI